MNVEVPAQHVESLGPFFGILGFMLLESFIVSLFFYKKGWF